MSIDAITDITGLLAIILGPILGVIAWRIKSNLESIRREREKMQEARREAYMKVLNPYISIFSDVKNESTQRKAHREVQSPNYRRGHFEFNMIGSDDAVKAMNDMVQHSRKLEKGDVEPMPDDLKKWGRILIAVRKDLGNKDTKLKDVDMLIAHISDIDRIM